MSKKFGKFLLFTAVAGAAAYGAYSYLQKKEQIVSPSSDEDADDDFDDFSEDLDEDLNSGKDRSYVALNLDKAEALASEAFHKAKEVITDSVMQVKETVKSVADSQGYHSSFTDLTPGAKDSSDSAEDSTEDDAAASEKEASTEKTTDTVDTADTGAADTDHAASDVPSDEKVEEFFDDEDDASALNNL